MVDRERVLRVALILLHLELQLILVLLTLKLVQLARPMRGLFRAPARRGKAQGKR